MKDKLYNNADSFAMSFDEEWENVDCDDIRLKIDKVLDCLLYTSPSPRDLSTSRMPSSA